MNNFLNRRKAQLSDSSDAAAHGQTEQQLRTSLEAQANQFEPTTDAYVRLQERVANAESGAPRGNSSTPRLAAMAAATLVVVGTAGYFGLRQDGLGGVSEIEATGQGEVVQQPTTTAEVEAEVAQTYRANPVAEEPDFPLVSGLNAAPEAADPVEAAVKFLELVRVDYHRLTLDGTTVMVLGRDADDAAGGLVSTLDIAIWDGSNTAASESGERTPHYVVTAARDGAISLDAFPDVRTTDSTIAVTGSYNGWANEWAGVNLFSSLDGLLLDSIKDAPIESASNTLIDLEFAVNGIDHGWVVIRAEGGAGELIGHFAAQPVFFAAPDPIEYRVAHLLVDDPDEGLVVRRLPGSDHDEEDVLAFGTQGIHRRGHMPVTDQDDGFEWWPITYAGDERGWVKARFLARSDEVSAEELTQIAERFKTIVLNPDQAIVDGAVDATLWPAAEYKPVQVGWVQGLRNVPSSDLSDPAWWDDSTQTWTIHPSLETGATQASLRTFLNLREGDVVEISDGGFQSPYSTDNEAIATSFGGMSEISIVFDGDNESVGRRVTLYVEQTVGEPIIVGISVWLWTP